MKHLNTKLLNIIKHRLRSKITILPESIKYGIKQRSLYYILSPLLFYTYESNIECSRCRDCGRNVHDFDVDNEIWNQIIGHEDGVWCWDCFCERARSKGVRNFTCEVIPHSKKKSNCSW